MIELNKKQVGALLKVMGKDSSRPVLENLYVTTINDKLSVIATDGYLMAVLEIDAEDGMVLNNKCIRRSAIEKWHKLATGKDRLNTNELIKISAQDYADNNGYYDGSYPDITSILDNSDKGEATLKIVFNAEYMKIVQDLAGKPLQYKLNGVLGALRADNEGDIYLIMPIKG